MLRVDLVPSFRKLLILEVTVQAMVNLLVTLRARGPFSRYLKYLVVGYMVQPLMPALRRRSQVDALSVKPAWSPELSFRTARTAQCNSVSKRSLMLRLGCSSVTETAFSVFEVHHPLKKQQTPVSF